MITNYADLQACTDSHDVARRLFKDTECGICFAHDAAGVSVAGYAEGADAECVSIQLEYPFTELDFWQAVQQADDEGCALWAEWNTDEDEDEESA